MKKITQFLIQLKSSLFVRNVATLATGTTLAQSVSIITAPILYRIYSKVDYGTLGLYMAIVGVVGVFSTLQYIQPVLLEKEDDDAKKIMWLNRVINIGVSLIVLLLVITLGDTLGRAMGNEAIMPWLYLAPISIFFTGQSQIFGIWANRKAKYKILSFNAILTALLVPAVSISVGLINNGPLGLFLGLLVSHVIPPIILLVALTKHDDLGLKYLDWAVIKEKAKTYKNYPFYSLPSEFINRLTNQLPVFMLSAFAGPAIVGVYNLCVRMLGLPIQLIGSSIARVFKQRAAADYNEKGDFRNVFVKTMKTLMAISIVPLIVILIFGPDIFSLAFGENWREAGVFAQILIFMFMMKLITAPLAYSYFIVDRLKEDLYNHIYMLVSSLSIFYFGFKLTDDYKIIIAVFSLNYVLIYLWIIFRAYYFTKLKA